MGTVYSVNVHTQHLKMAVVNHSTNFLEWYNDLWEIRDRRVDDWLFMSSCWPTLTLCMSYLYCSMVLFPTLMKDRPAFEFRTPIPWIQVYNVFIVGISTAGFWECFRAGWGSHFSWICQPVEMDSDPDSPAMRMAAMAHLYFLSKFIEFADTFIMIARKKYNQVNRLQLIHHSIMPIFTFMMCRWLPGGHETFFGMFNSLVHMIMYSYYFLAQLGPHMAPYLWWKKYLTSFQILQFIVTFAKSMVVVLGISNCGYPWQFSLITAALMVMFSYSFLSSTSIVTLSQKSQLKLNKLLVNVA